MDRRLRRGLVGGAVILLSVSAAAANSAAASTGWNIQSAPAALAVVGPTNSMRGAALLDCGRVHPARQRLGTSDR